MIKRIENKDKTKFIEIETEADFGTRREYAENRKPYTLVYDETGKASIVAKKYKKEEDAEFIFLSNSTIKTHKKEGLTVEEILGERDKEVLDLYLEAIDVLIKENGDKETEKEKK